MSEPSDKTAKQEAVAWAQEQATALILMSMSAQLSAPGALLRMKEALP